MSKTKENKSPWILVSKRLPEEGQRVVCLGKKKIPLFVEYTKGRFERYIDISAGERLFIVNYTDIFAWMEIPTYNEESGDN